MQAALGALLQLQWLSASNGGYDHCMGFGRREARKSSKNGSNARDDDMPALRPS